MRTKTVFGVGCTMRVVRFYTRADRPPCCEELMERVEGLEEMIKELRVAIKNKL